MSKPLHTPIAIVVAALSAACGGGDAPVELTFDSNSPMETSLPEAIVTGKSFVPAGSVCPDSKEFVVIGTPGPYTIRVVNENTGAFVAADHRPFWVCNAEGGRHLSWTSDPLPLVLGANRVTATMTDSQRSSSASTIITRR